MKGSYGLTESIGVCFRIESQEVTNYIGSVGHLLARSEAKIVDPVTGVVLPPSSQGVIWIRGQQIVKDHLFFFKFKGENINNCIIIILSSIEFFFGLGNIHNSLCSLNIYSLLSIILVIYLHIVFFSVQVSPIEFEDLLLMHQDIIRLLLFRK
jgi:AMP-binding enzyme